MADVAMLSAPPAQVTPVDEEAPVTDEAWKERPGTSIQNGFAPMKGIRLRARNRGLDVLDDTGRLQPAIAETGAACEANGTGQGTSHDSSAIVQIPRTEAEGFCLSHQICHGARSHFLHGLSPMNLDGDLTEFHL